MSTDESTKNDKVANLEREGDVAADYLEELLDIADLDGDIDMDVEGGRVRARRRASSWRAPTGMTGNMILAPRPAISSAAGWARASTRAVVGGLPVQRKARRAACGDGKYSKRFNFSLKWTAQYFGERLA